MFKIFLSHMLGTLALKLRENYRLPFLYKKILISNSIRPWRLDVLNSLNPESLDFSLKISHVTDPPLNNGNFTAR